MCQRLVNSFDAFLDLVLLLFQLLFLELCPKNFLLVLFCLSAGLRGENTFRSQPVVDACIAYLYVIMLVKNLTVMSKVCISELLLVQINDKPFFVSSSNAFAGLRPLFLCMNPALPSFLYLAISLFTFLRVHPIFNACSLLVPICFYQLLNDVILVFFCHV